MNQCISTTKRAAVNCGEVPLVKIIKGGEQKC
jgi:hypothetical protein